MLKATYLILRLFLSKLLFSNSTSQYPVPILNLRSRVTVTTKSNEIFANFSRISGLPEKLSGQNSDFHRNFGFARNW
jgi:hypothetical protein